MNRIPVFLARHNSKLDYHEDADSRWPLETKILEWRPCTNSSMSPTKMYDGIHARAPREMTTIARNIGKAFPVHRRVGIKAGQVHLKHWMPAGDRDELPLFSTCVII